MNDDEFMKYFIYNISCKTLEEYDHMNKLNVFLKEHETKEEQCEHFVNQLKSIDYYDIFMNCLKIIFPNHISIISSTSEQIFYNLFITCQYIEQHINYKYDNANKTITKPFLYDYGQDLGKNHIYVFYYLRAYNYPTGVNPNIVHQKMIDYFMAKMFYKKLGSLKSICDLNIVDI